MYSLIIETSSQKAIILLESGKLALEVYEMESGQTLSNSIVGAIKAMLSKRGLKCSDLGLIAAGIGPGSYTGIRVAATVAKSISYAVKIPLTGFCSYHGMQIDSEGPFIIASPLRPEGLFLAKGIKEKEHIRFSSSGFKPWPEAEEELKASVNIYTPCKESFKAGPELFSKIRECSIDPERLILAAYREYERAANRDFNLLY